jgi:hypothetical protein
MGASFMGIEAAVMFPKRIRHTGALRYFGTADVTHGSLATCGPLDFLLFVSGSVSFEASRGGASTAYFSG